MELNAMRAQRINTIISSFFIRQPQANDLVMKMHLFSVAKLRIWCIW